MLMGHMAHLKKKQFLAVNKLDHMYDFTSKW